MVKKNKLKKEELNKLAGRKRKYLVGKIKFMEEEANELSFNKSNFDK